MADTPQQMLQTIKVIAGDLSKREAGIKKAYDTATKDVRSAIDDGSENEINVVKPELDTAVEAVDKGLDACDRMQAIAKEMIKDKAFVAKNLEDIKKLLGSVSKKQNTFSEQATALRKLGEEADKALGVAAKSSKQIEAELGGLKNRAKKIAEDILACKTDIPKLETKARDATQKGDEKTAEPARIAIWDAMVQPKRRLGELKPLYEKFKKENPDLDKPLKAELTWVGDGITDATDTIAAGEKTFNELIKLKQTTMAAKPPATPEVPKAELLKVAPIVGFDPKDSRGMAELARILNRTPHDKWADGLAKLAVVLKLKNTNGKAMVIAIDKLPYFKKQSLIDI